MFTGGESGFFTVPICHFPFKSFTLKAQRFFVFYSHFNWTHLFKERKASPDCCYPQKQALCVCVCVSVVFKGETRGNHFLSLLLTPVESIVNYPFSIRYCIIQACAGSRSSFGTLAWGPFVFHGWSNQSHAPCDSCRVGGCLHRVWRVRELKNPIWVKIAEKDLIERRHYHNQAWNSGGNDCTFWEKY